MLRCVSGVRGAVNPGFELWLLRHRVGLNQYDVAGALGVSASYISMVENELTRWTPTTDREIRRAIFRLARRGL
jgi:transcriptional regulator with XRE-family HTH domain